MKPKKTFELTLIKEKKEVVGRVIVLVILLLIALFVFALNIKDRESIEEEGFLTSSKLKEKAEGELATLTHGQTQTTPLEPYTNYVPWDLPQIQWTIMPSDDEKNTKMVKSAIRYSKNSLNTIKEYPDGNKVVTVSPKSKILGTYMATRIEPKEGEKGPVTFKAQEFRYGRDRTGNIANIAKIDYYVIGGPIKFEDEKGNTLDGNGIIATAYYQQTFSNQAKNLVSAYSQIVYVTDKDGNIIHSELSGNFPEDLDILYPSQNGVWV